MPKHHLVRRTFLNASMAASAASLLPSGAGAAAAGSKAGRGSMFFATAFTEYAASHPTDSDGDLWPSCWADDDNIYAANGDGRGFSDEALADVVVNKIVGTPASGITGERLAAAGQVANVYADAAKYNRKPTGIVAVDGNGDGRDEIYLAVQDLRFAPAELAFNDAPSASICVSEDYGRTWRKTPTAMFGDYVFTTIMFLDFGKSQRHAAVLGPDGANYVYAYGLDNNWRDSFTDTVPSPTSMYLARVPRSAITERGSWQFFAGLRRDGSPTWSRDIGERRAVLHDERRIYPNLLSANGPSDLSVISQGGVVYNAPLRRYLYTSWTEYTFEFYEAPMPWGPWKVFLTKDAGGYPWFGAPGEVRDVPTTMGHSIPQLERRGSATDEDCPGPKNGGYGCTIPSKFISADGTRMWLQSNWFVGRQCGVPNYQFSLRRLKVTPRVPLPVTTPAPGDNLAVSGAGVTTIEKVAHYGHGTYYNDGRLDRSEDSYDNSRKTVDFWGYVWEKPYRFNRVEYTTGAMYDDGGWFTSTPRVQVRRGDRWIDARGVHCSPAYPADAKAGPFKTFSLVFQEESADGVRVVGAPGGAAHFTSIAELAVYFDERF